jgi:hypothetical protein
LITEKIFISARGDLACFSENVLGLNSCHRFIRWWLCFDVIQDLVNDVWVSDVSDDTHGSATQRAVARAFSLLSGIAHTLGQKANALDTIGPAT